MADKKISALTAASTPLAGSEVLPIVQSGTTVKVSVANLTAGRAVSAGDLTYTGSLTGSTGTIAIGTTQIVKDTSGNIAIGAATTTSYLNYRFVDIRGSDGGVVSLGGTNGSLEFAADITNSKNFVTYRNNYPLIFQSASTPGSEVTRFELTSAGDFKILTAGKGIDFSANGGDVLTQYDEGTWTPTITAYSGTITTVGAVVGTYTRVGRLVTLSGSFAITTNGTGSVLLQITGLPFAATSGTPANFTGTGICPTTGKQLVLQYNVVAAKIYVSYYDGTYPGADASNYAFSITYEIS